MTDSSSLPGPSGKGIRTKLGCFTCRARKVKCDLSRPTCQTCTRLNLDCTYTKPDKQLNIPRLRRGRKRRTSEGSGLGLTQGLGEEEDDRRGSINTLPDLWGYQQSHQQPGYGYPEDLMRGRMSLDHGYGYSHGHGNGHGNGNGNGNINGNGQGNGQGQMGIEEGLSSSTYLNSLLRPQPRRESMPINLPSSYNPSGLGMTMGNGVGRYGRENTPNLFNGYQMSNNTTMGGGHLSGSGGGGGCTRELHRSMTPSSTSMTTPQPWDMPLTNPDMNADQHAHPHGHGGYSNELDISQNQGNSTSTWSQPINSYDPFSNQDPLIDFRPPPRNWLIDNNSQNGNGRQINGRSSSPFPMIYPTNIPNQARSHSLSLPYPTTSTSTSNGWPSATPQGYHYEDPDGPKYPPL